MEQNTEASQAVAELITAELMNTIASKHMGWVVGVGGWADAMQAPTEAAQGEDSARLDWLIASGAFIASFNVGKYAVMCHPGGNYLKAAERFFIVRLRLARDVLR